MGDGSGGYEVFDLYPIDRPVRGTASESRCNHVGDNAQQVNNAPLSHACQSVGYTSDTFNPTTAKFAQFRDPAVLVL